MKAVRLAAVVLGCTGFLAVAMADSVQRVAVPPPTDPNAYQPQPQPKPMPQEVVGQPQQAPPPGAMPMNAAQMASAANGLPEEEAFVQAYTKRNPRFMVFVNRTIHGDALSKADFDQLILAGQKQTAAGQVAPNQSEKYDEIGATHEDYEMIEASLVDYMDCGGRVVVKDSDMVRSKLDREKVLRIENSDSAAIRSLNTELQTDVLMQVKASPTHQSQWPNGAVRLLVKTMSTSDGRILSSAFVDMPLPMSKDTINVFTRYLAEKTMQKLIAVWSGNAQWDPIEVRIYKAAGVDDALTIRKFLQKVTGVERVTTLAATGSTATGYASLSVAFNGAPEDLYSDLKDALKTSTGLKAIDVQSNTVDLEVTGPMDLTTTTQTTETKTTVETKTTETKAVEPIRPAPPATGNP